MEQNKLTVIEPAQQVARKEIFDLGPTEMVEKGRAIAKVLSNVIDTHKLYTVIQGRKYVNVEGWITLGNFLGVLPQELKVERSSDGTYTAIVELVSMKSAQVVGRGSAICTPHERIGKEENVRRSMALTRATSKAYRMGFSWIMALANFATTPAEEMPDEMPRQQTYTKPAASKPDVRAEKKESTFDEKNKTHSAWLSKFLEENKVDPGFWANIASDLQGKSKDALEEVLLKYKNKEPAI
jgi:hypothetical protein